MSKLKLQDNGYMKQQNYLKQIDNKLYFKYNNIKTV